MSRVVLLDIAIIIFWLLFWLANGLDKFLNGTSMALFDWVGKDRVAQFSVYFDGLGIPEDWAIHVAQAIGSWEIVMGLTFAGSMVCLAWERIKANFWTMIRAGFFLTAMTFTAFATFDIVAGDRFELLAAKPQVNPPNTQICPKYILDDGRTARQSTHDRTTGRSG